MLKFEDLTAKGLVDYKFNFFKKITVDDIDSGKQRFMNILNDCSNYLGMAQHLENVDFNYCRSNVLFVLREEGLI